MSIIVDSISFSYPRGNIVLQNLHAEIPEGSFVLIGGRNGSGKSTLLRLMNGLLKPTDGSVRIDGHDTRTTAPSRLASLIAVTFQNPSDQIFASSVLREVMFGPRNLRRKNPEQDARSALELLGLDSFTSMHPYDLSHAHRRLLTVASAVATGAPFLAFDEPTAGLSQPERLTLSDALQALQKNGRSIIVVSHDFEFFLPLCQRLLIIAGGGIAFDHPVRHSVQHEAALAKTGVLLPLSIRLQ